MLNLLDYLSPENPIVGGLVASSIIKARLKAKAKALAEKNRVQISVNPEKPSPVKYTTTIEQDRYR